MFLKLFYTPSFFCTPFHKTTLPTLPITISYEIVIPRKKARTRTIKSIVKKAVDAGQFIIGLQSHALKALKDQQAQALSRR